MGRPRRRGEDNIRINLEEIGINAGNWVDSACECPCEFGIEPPGSISHGVSFNYVTISLLISQHNGHLESVPAI